MTQITTTDLPVPGRQTEESFGEILLSPKFDLKPSNFLVHHYKHVTKLLSSWRVKWSQVTLLTATKTNRQQKAKILKRKDREVKSVCFCPVFFSAIGAKCFCGYE